MSRVARLEQQLLDLLMLAASARAGLKARERLGLVDAIKRAKAVLDGKETMPKEDAEAELSAAVAACGAAGVGWPRVVEIVNGYIDTHPGAPSCPA